MVVIEKQKVFWNSVAENIEFQKEVHLSLLMEYINKNDYILDFGCGYGRVMDILQKSNFNKIIGIDSSEKMIERGKLQFPTFQLLHLLPFSKLPFYDHTFDAIIVVDVFASIIHNNLQEFIMNELSRVLKPNGIIYIYDFILSERTRNIERYNRYKDTFPNYGTFLLDGGLIVRHLSKQRIYKLTERYDLQVFETFDCVTLNGNTTDGFCYIGKKI
jgi:ubiquinone/menaquinone biosynthesis C-methylase UbiE